MRSVIVVGLGFGDEGKGSVVDYLTRKYDSHLNIRFNGGAQAAHNVVLADGRHHCFSQWGSGTLAGAKTYLSKYMVVNPLFMIPEGDHLVSLGVTDAFERMFIDQNALITTPFHVSLNRLREISRRVLGTLEHGTCGMGIGETVDWATRCPELAIRMRDLLNLRDLSRKLESLRVGICREVQNLECEWPEKAQIELDILDDRQTTVRFIDASTALLKRGVTVLNSLHLGRIFDPKDTVIFEGAQGVLLDEEWGFHPHTTWSDCTFGNAMKFLKQFAGVKVTRIGVTRAYHTRHGTGPLPSEGSGPKVLDHNVSGQWQKVIDHNVSGQWQGDFRVGLFDFVMARYSKFIVESLDGVAINHLDQVSGPQKVCIGHNFQGYNLYRIRSGINFDLHQDLGVSYRDVGEENEPVQSVVAPIYSELKDVDRLVDGISKVFKAPVVLKGYGQTAEDKREV
jgi:adenylosuccinate synthase